ncbi:2031_t:CDS:2 [Cetraspora pellucida]|uniref:2031_t:CDS:1 n=1 Tax=Cetraspora pellucida TaxID=1433469 RepID=A0ACA9NF07_9GLOM|nr:2031_t:CDS:2 [Cetraspora pellucida]
MTIGEVSTMVQVIEFFNFKLVNTPFRAVKMTAFATSQHDVPLSGFKECEGTFPNKLTFYDYSPNPAISGQPVTHKTHATDNVAIKNGSKLRIQAHFNNRLIEDRVTDFCKDWNSGGKCSGATGNVQYEKTEILKDLSKIKDLPRNQSLDFNLRIELHTPQNGILCCIEGPFHLIIPS